MRLRPSTEDDHRAVLALLADRDQTDFGERDFSESLVLDQWRTREFQPRTDAVVAEEAGQVVGYAAAFLPGELAFVHPRREGEGIGTQLLRWAEERARPRATFRQRVAAGNDRARELLGRAGYRCVRSVHCLAWSAGSSVSGQETPVPGTSLEPIDPEGGSQELHQVDALAFADNADYHPEPFEAFCDEHLAAPDLHHPSSRIARRQGRPAGFVLCRRSGARGYIDLLAVLPEHRGQGLGRWLLLHALGSLAADGATEIRLDVASDNPSALRLYEGVGLAGRHEVQVYEKPAG